MKFLRLLAWPLAVLYGLVTWLRNKLYDWGVLPSKSFDEPAVIVVGNLSAGGTGKTPHVEYIVRLLHEKYQVATLSRGYGRKTSGFLLASQDSTTYDIGDEPKQFRHRFPPEVPVAVDGNRVRGIKKIKQQFPENEIVVLDDAYQHRSVKAGLNIMLTDYANLYYTDHLLPTGLLRESRAGARRADVIVVTKTPQIFSPLERRRIIREINPPPWQHVYFSYIRYGDFVPFHMKPGSGFLNKEYYFERKYSIVLMTGIANAHSLEYFLKDKVSKLIPYKFRDHHEFAPVDLMRLREIFDSIAGENKIILTTEKDAMRLRKPGLLEFIEGLPLFYIPIEIAFHDKDQDDFNSQILEYVRSNQHHRSLHKG